MTSSFSCRAREVTCHYGHVNRFCCLLTAQEIENEEEERERALVTGEGRHSALISERLNTLFSSLLKINSYSMCHQ